jgi:hypothetical protein
MRLTPSIHQQRGSVVLVALCFLAVLGIALASYLAVCHQAVKLSNREYQRSISLQLAESGIEQSLWSFNWNNWSSPWDLTTIPGSAIRHITFPANKYNNGVAGSIMLRVDRYDATVWNNFTSYKVASHDLVWYGGVWYQCVIDDSSYSRPSDGIPNKWRGAPCPWNASANYQSNNVVLYGGGAYQCVAANINTAPIAANIPTYWTTLVAAVANWNGGTSYATNDIVLSGGMSYRCVAANSNKPPPDPNYWVGSPTIYSEGVATPPDNPAGAVRTQLRAFVAPASLFPNAIAATSTVSLLSTNSAGLVDSYNAALGTYPPSVADLPARGYSATVAGASNAGTALTVSGGTVQGYLSVPAKTSPPYPLYANLAGTLKGASAGTGIDPTRLLRDPYIPQFDLSVWDINRSYRPNDIVFYGTDHYVCIAAPTSHQNPSDTTYWKKNEILPMPTADIELPPAAPYQNTNIYVIQDSPFNLTHKITIKGSVALFIESDLQISAGGNIYIPPMSDGYPYARAQIQFSGRLRVHSAGTIDNQTFDPKKLILVGSAMATPSNHIFYSPTKFYGAIYMPFATSTLIFANPLGSGDPEVFGAVSAQKITFTSPAKLHYDTSLRTTTFPGIDIPFTVTDWRELTDPAEKIVLP